MNRRLLSILMTDIPSAHERLTNLLRRRAPGLLSVVTATGEEPGMARLTVALRATAAEAEGCRLQVAKMVDVAEATLLDDFLEVQLVLLRLEVAESGQPAALGALDRAGARLLRLTPESLVAQLADGAERVEAAIEALRAFGPLTVTRTGPVAVAL